MRKAGHTMAIRRIPADTSQPAREYQRLYQCGFTKTSDLRVIVEGDRELHLWRATPVPGPRRHWRCPCLDTFTTRAARAAHMLHCPKAPEGWTS